MEWDVIAIAPVVAVAVKLLSDGGVRKLLRSIITRPRERDAMVRVESGKRHAIVLEHAPTASDVERVVDDAVRHIIEREPGGPAA